MPPRLAHLLTGARRAWAVVVLGLIGASLVLGVLGAAERAQQPGDELPVGSDSALAAQWQSEIPDADGSPAFLFFTSETGAFDRDTLEQLGEIAARYQDGAALIPSESGDAAFAVIEIDSATSSELSETIEGLRADLREQVPEGVATQVTGPAAITGDLAAVFEGADLRLLAATATVVALLLIVTYRSPVLWLVPLTVIAVADRVAVLLATHALNALIEPDELIGAGFGDGLAWNESTTGILSVLVFGAGTNYALLLISRYRDELRTTQDRRAALRRALTRTAEAVFFSAATVVGVATLALSVIPSTRGLGLACAIGIVVAAFSALVILPAALSLFGRWIFWPRIPRAGDTRLSDGHSLWRRIGDAVAARPTAFVAATLVVLLLGAIGLTQVRLGLPTDEQFLDTPESITAAERLSQAFPDQSTDPITIVTRDVGADLRATVEQVEGVTRVYPGAATDDLATYSVFARGNADSQEAQATVVDIRERLAAEHPHSHVGGPAAQNLDTADGDSRDRLLLIPLILLMVLAALMLLLRSLVAPLILVTTVVGTYLASLGLGWWIFTGPLGFSALDSAVPLLTFLFLVALGVDYNIFLVTRAREERPQHGTREGMLRALAATGGVITSAGILLAAVFAVLGVLPLVVLAQVGTVIGIGVLLDTLLVRTVLVPALALLLGDRFWWPLKSAGLPSAQRVPSTR